jgi:hypothetical protein
MQDNGFYVCGMVFYNAKFERLHLCHLVWQILLQHELFMWMQSEHRKGHIRSVHESCVTMMHTALSVLC